jgi:hypothetical protein
MIASRTEEPRVADDNRDARVKVIDRRWFTGEGEPRRPIPEEEEAGEAAPPEAPPPSQAPPSEAAPHAEPGGAPPGESPTERTTPLGLLDLIDALAQPAAALLGGQVPGRGRDLAGARYYIDLLGVVQERMRGQLSPEESRYIEDVLYQLRSLYVAATR